MISAPKFPDPANSEDFLTEAPPVDSPDLRLRPLFPQQPPSAPVQGRLQGPPAKSKFLAVNTSRRLPNFVEKVNNSPLKAIADFAAIQNWVQ